MSVFEVDTERVGRLAETMKALVLARDFAREMAPEVNASEESTLRAFLWASSICHSTHGGLEGWFGARNVKGWDYLLQAFCCAAEQDSEEISTRRMKAMGDRDLLDLLSRWVENPTIGLLDLDRRAAMLNQCAADLEQRFDGRVGDLLAVARDQVGGITGAYAQLEHLSPFRDPLKKKSTAFLTTVHFSGIWQAEDTGNIVPMIDYHRMRLLCRTGCVKVRDPDLLRSLILRERVAPDIEESLRVASADACILGAAKAGMVMFEFDNLLWAHARSCCRHRPLCVSRHPEHDTFYRFIEHPMDGNCVFVEWCLGQHDETTRAIWEPVVETENY